MFNLTQESTTAQRKAYANKLLTLMVDQTAQDLIDGTTTRDIGAKALCGIVTSVLPNTGKGHAAKVQTQVDEALDNAIAAINNEMESDAA